MLWGLQLRLEILSQKRTYALHTAMAVWLCHTWLKPHISQSQHNLIPPRTGGESLCPVTQTKGEALPFPLHLQHTMLSTQLERAGWRVWIKQTFVWPHANNPFFFMNACHLQGKVQCQIIEGSNYLLEIFVNPLNGFGTLLILSFLFFFSSLLPKFKQLHFSALSLH